MVTEFRAAERSFEHTLKQPATPLRMLCYQASEEGDILLRWMSKEKERKTGLGMDLGPKTSIGIGRPSSDSTTGR
jgi:hypothetical protein